jgi:hypothetical protein
VTASATLGAHNVTVTNPDGGSGTGTGVFTVAVAAPPTPTLNPQPNGTFADHCTGYGHTLTWSVVTSPDGHTADYQAQVSTDPTFATANYDSGWIIYPAGPSYAIEPDSSDTTWYWRVRARDSVDTNSVSDWSAGGDNFHDSGTYSWDCSCDNSCGGSCPFVFTWNNDRFNYITDLQGPEIMTSKNALKKSPQLIRPVTAVLDGLDTDRDNRYRLMIWESLQEMTYLDEVKLLVVDYPEGYQIATSSAESTLLFGYVNPFKIYTIKDPVPLLAATDMNGNDILANLANVDNNPGPVEHVLTDNFYTFDFGAIKHPEYAKLLIDGWSVYGQTKEKVDNPVQPYIEVVDNNGKWVKVKSIGNSSGDLKTMVVDIANIFLSPDHRIRLHLGIYRSRWVIDRVRLDDSAPVEVTVREVGVASAVLQPRGNAIERHATNRNRFILGEQPQPAIDAEKPAYGRFTRYGEVTELLAAQDDMYVIMKHGDALDVRFPAVDQPPQAGMTRGFVIKADLYYKAYKNSNRVEPLPFHSMSGYPYPADESYPMDKKHRDYLEKYNTREYIEPGAKKMQDLLPMAREAEAADIRTHAGKPEMESTAPERALKAKEPSPSVTMKQEAETQPSLWQMLGRLSAKLWLVIGTVLQWLISLVGG